MTASHHRHVALGGACSEEQLVGRRWERCVHRDIFPRAAARDTPRRPDSANPNPKPTAAAPVSFAR